MYGWTDNYVRVGISANNQYENKILPVELGARTNDDYMVGTLTPQAEQEEQIIAAPYPTMHSFTLGLNVKE
jgi:hypothetical protein